MHFSSLPSTRVNYVDVLNGRHARNDARARWEQGARERFHRNIFADTRPSATNAALGAGWSTTRDFQYWEHQLLTHLAFIKPSFGDEGVMLPCEVVGQDLLHVDSAILPNLFIASLAETNTNTTRAHNSCSPSAVACCRMLSRVCMTLSINFVKVGRCQVICLYKSRRERFF